MYRLIAQRRKHEGEEQERSCEKPVSGPVLEDLNINMGRNMDVQLTQHHHQ